MTPHWIKPFFRTLCISVRENGRLNKLLATNAFLNKLCTKQSSFTTWSSAYKLTNWFTEQHFLFSLDSELEIFWSFKQQHYSRSQVEFTNHFSFGHLNTWTVVFTHVFVIVNTFWVGFSYICCEILKRQSYCKNIPKNILKLEHKNLDYLISSVIRWSFFPSETIPNI